MSGYCHTGHRLTHPSQAPPDDERVTELLKAYHCKNITGWKVIHKMLLAKGIVMRFVSIPWKYGSTIG